MTRWPRILPPALVVLAALPMAASEGPPSNAEVLASYELQKWRKSPPLYARLQQDARDFLALPPERREQLVRLDAAVRKQPSAAQARLLDVAGRYAEWLDRLPASERKTVEEAPDTQARLRAVAA